MMVYIAVIDIRNVYVRVSYESPMAKKRKVTAKRVLIGIASLILVSSYFILGPISDNCNSKSLAVILIKFLKTAQLSILTSPMMFKFRFRLSRKLSIERFRYRFFSCSIIMVAAATAANCNVSIDILHAPLNNV